MVAKMIESRCCFFLGFGRLIPLTAVVFAALLVSLPAIVTAQSDSKGAPAGTAAKQANGSSSQETKGRSLTAGLKTAAPADDMSSKSLTKGLDSKASSGDNKNGSAKRGSSTRREPGSPKIDFSSIPKYKRLKMVQLDDSLKKSALESAAKIDEMIDNGLKENKIRPEKVTDDYEFARRAYLDISGTIPTGRQAVEFVR